MDFDYPMSHAADSMPTRSLWVGNVDPGLSNQDLIAIFGKYGRVESLRLLPDKECAFVNFLRVEDAIRAKEDMHSGARIGNNTVRVGFGKGESYATGDAQAMQPTRALWIGNIAPAATPDTLSSAFEPYGTIESARVLSHKNCGFVNFVRLEDAVRAKQAMNGKSIDGSVVRIGYAKVPAAKNESSLKLRNPVPSAAPLTVSGQIAEADAITGTTQRGLGSDMVLEPGFTLAIDEDLVAFPYATQLPNLPEPTQLPSLQQSRLRDIRKLMEATGSPIPKAEFDQLVNELMPYVVELCTDYVGNVLIQKIAERGDPAQKLELVRRVGPHMTSIGVHKNGTWAVQRIIDTADSDEQRRIIVESIKPYTPQLLLDQLGNYVAQKLAVQASNQFVFDAIHARCMEVAQGRFGARAIRTCLESTHATKLQQKLVAVALVTNAVSLATNANGHLLVNWLLESSKFSGRFRVLSHQLAPHLRYLATHKLGASTISKILDQTSEPDARDLILNTL
ncbi:ARM repeat-containing protein, partial [Martensiomyces pterosporus]